MGYSQRRQKGDYRRVPETSGIYRLYQGDRVVKVGETSNLRSRLEKVERDLDYWGSYDYKTTKYVPTYERKKMERRTIRRQKPTRSRIYG